MTPIERLGRFPVLPILNQSNPKQALSTAEALLEGGLDIMEITLRTETAKESLQAVRKEFPNILLGAGSIQTPKQIKWAKDHEIDFVVSPGWSDENWECSRDIDIPLFPGVISPSELMHALAQGCRTPKIFPIEPIGGIAYLKALLAPFSKQRLRCIPTGGIRMEMVSKYLRIGSTLTVGGSWITPFKLIESNDFKTITRLANSSLLLANQDQ